MGADVEKKWLLRKEAAEYLGLSVSALAHMACEMRGPRYFRAGKHTRYLVEDLDTWVKEQEHRPFPYILQGYTRRAARGR